MTRKNRQKLINAFAIVAIIAMILTTVGGGLLALL